MLQEVLVSPNSFAWKQQFGMISSKVLATPCSSQENLVKGFYTIHRAVGYLSTGLQVRIFKAGREPESQFLLYLNLIHCPEIKLLLC